MVVLKLQKLTGNVTLGVNSDGSIFREHDEDPNAKTEKRESEFWEYCATNGQKGVHEKGERPKRDVFTPTIAEEGDIVVMTYNHGGLFFRINQHLLGRAFEEVPKAGHLDVGDRPYPYIRC